MSGADDFTIPEIAQILCTPQHTLIHLCEQGGITPDFADATGRGSSRRFSKRNVFEFAIALRLRALMLPVAAAGGVIRVLRAFERRVRDELPGFELPGGLQKKSAPDLRVVLSDGNLLFFTLAAAGKTPKVFGGVEIGKLISAPTKGKEAMRLVQKAVTSGGETTFGRPEGSRYGRVELSLTRIAQYLDDIQ